MKPPGSLSSRLRPRQLLSLSPVRQSSHTKGAPYMTSGAWTSERGSNGLPPPGEEGREQRNQGRGGALSWSPGVRDRRREADSLAESAAQEARDRAQGQSRLLPAACLLSASFWTLGPKAQVTNKGPTPRESPIWPVTPPNTNPKLPTTTQLRIPQSGYPRHVAMR